MFAGFNVKIDDSAVLKDYLQTGRKIFENSRVFAEKNLKKYVFDADYLDGSLIQEEWFPEVKADIFLSHSHKDEKTVISLAGWLYEMFGLKSFIDSCIWGYSEDLIKVIDDAYCRKKQIGYKSIYSYKKRNYSTSHVHMMLSMALLKMIDNAECLFFINTPDSISVSESIGTKSSSPWIYAELQASRLIRHKDLLEYRPEADHSDKEALEAANLQIKYNVQLNNLTDLNNIDLLYWQENGRKDICKYPLDVLYEYKNLIPKTALEY